MKNIKKWLAAAGAGLAVIAMTAMAMPAGTVSAAAAQNGRGPGGQADTYLADALGVTIDDLTTAYTAARVVAIDQAVTDGLLTQEQADALKSGAGRIDDRGLAPIGQNKDAQDALLAEQLGITVDQLEAAETTANDARLAAAVEAGQITQEQADQMQAQDAFRQYMNQADVQAQLQAAYTSAVQGAVQAGVITQEQADTILSNSNGFGRFGEMPGFGDGHGFGGRHGGRGGAGGPGTQMPSGQQPQNDATLSGASL